MRVPVQLDWPGQGHEREHRHPAPNLLAAVPARGQPATLASTAWAAPPSRPHVHL